MEHAFWVGNLLVMVNVIGVLYDLFVGEGRDVTPILD